LRRFVKPGDTILDVGACIGTHTVAFAGLVGPAGLVHAFEPQRRNFLMLAGNVALNALENVVCHWSAVGDSSGEIRVPSLPPPDTTFNYAAVSCQPSSETGENVPLVMLDSLELSACRAIKVDTEGMEPQVINGARTLIERYRPLLYVENERPGSSKRISGILSELGYSAWWSIFPYFDPRNFYSNTVNVWEKYMPAVNLLCAPKELHLEVPDHEPFLGENDDWKSCLQRGRSPDQH
jgi:FkbM family methyltransferase